MAVSSFTLKTDPALLENLYFGEELTIKDLVEQLKKLYINQSDALFVLRPFIKTEANTAKSLPRQLSYYNNSLYHIPEVSLSSLDNDLACSLMDMKLNEVAHPITKEITLNVPSYHDVLRKARAIAESLIFVEVSGQTLDLSVSLEDSLSFTKKAALRLAKEPEFDHFEFSSRNQLQLEKSLAENRISLGDTLCLCRSSATVGTFFVREPNGKTMRVPFTASLSVLDVKQIVEREKGIASASHILIHLESIKSGKSGQLEDSRSLASYGIKNDDTLLVVLRKVTPIQIFSQKPPSVETPYPTAKAAQEQSSSPSEFEVFIITLAGKKIALVCTNSTTVAGLKQLIREKEGVPLDQQRLIFAGNQLEDDRTLKDYNVQHHSSVHLVLFLRGGMNHLSSGRHDFCSLESPADPYHIGPSVMPKTFSVTHFTKDGRSEEKTFYAHPYCSQERILRMIRMEFDEDFFTDLDDESFSEILNNVEIRKCLSREAIIRLYLAVKPKLFFSKDVQSDNDFDDLFS